MYVSWSSCANKLVDVVFGVNGIGLNAFMRVPYLPSLLARIVRGASTSPRAQKRYRPCGRPVVAKARSRKVASCVAGREW